MTTLAQRSLAAAVNTYPQQKPVSESAVEFARLLESISGKCDLNHFIKVCAELKSIGKVLDFEGLKPEALERFVQFALDRIENEA